MKTSTTSRSDKERLYDLWEAVHRLHPIFDFDSTQTADELMADLQEILKTYK